MLRLFVCVLALCAAACDSGSPSSPPDPPTSPTPTPTPPPPAPTTNTVTGTLTATNGGQPLGGITVNASGLASTATDAGGGFTLTTPVATTSAALELTGAGIVPRRLTLATRTRTVGLDAIQLTGGFSLNVYRQLVRNGFEEPGSLQPLRRWTDPPRIYVRTVFGSQNREVDAGTLDMVTGMLASGVSLWTGGRMSPATIERGTGTREGMTGWLTVVWSEALGDSVCGRALVGANPGRIELHPRNAGCRCPGDAGQVSRWVVLHEIGHAMGFWHTDSRDDVMFDTFNACQGNASARERLHAGIAYARPAGNLDPDTDPSSLVTLLPAGPMVR